MSASDLLSMTCTIRRLTAVKDSVLGETTYTFADTTGVPCLVQTITQAWQNMPATAADSKFDIFFEPGTALYVTDQIVTISGMTNVQLELTSEGVDDAGMGEYVRCTARHLTGGG